MLINGNCGGCFDLSSFTEFAIAALSSANFLNDKFCKLNVILVIVSVLSFSKFLFKSSSSAALTLFPNKFYTIVLSALCYNAF
jgi:hypothetical protein